MFPGFVYMYRDKEDFIHLYFFNGIDDNDKPIYKDIDFSDIPFKYTCDKQSDFIKDYKFRNKTIIQINCKLAYIEGDKIETKVLSL